jgi:hypothetical protein
MTTETSDQTQENIDLEQAVAFYVCCIGAGAAHIRQTHICSSANARDDLNTLIRGVTFEREN